MKNLNRLILILASGFVMIAFQNCSDVNFASSNLPTNSKISDLGQEVVDRQPDNQEQPPTNTTGGTTVGTTTGSTGGSTTPPSNTPPTNTQVGQTPDDDDTADCEQDQEGQESQVVCENDDKDDDSGEDSNDDQESSDSDDDDVVVKSCDISDEELQSLILRVNIKEAFLDNTSVKVMTGSQNLLQLTEGEIGIVTTSEVEAHQLRLVLEDSGNTVVTGSGSSETTNNERNIVLKTPSGQQSGLKIELGSGADATREFEGVKTYIVKFGLDARTQIVQAGSKCILKPVLRATEVTEVSSISSVTAGQ